MKSQEYQQACGLDILCPSKMANKAVKGKRDVVKSLVK